MPQVILNFITSREFLLQAELFLRILIAMLSGAFIGYERTNRGKGAGIRTHTIVAIASCLIMIISQYGFDGFFQNFSNGNVDLSLDPARVAAQIVSGIGFLGAGTIFVQKNAVKGLTTAAGIWATAGIGMALGCGMYFMGIVCTVIIVVVQLIMHKSLKFNQAVHERKLSVVMVDNEENVTFVLDILKNNNYLPIEATYKRADSGLLTFEILVQHNQEIDVENIVAEVYKNNDIKSVTI